MKTLKTIHGDLALPGFFPDATFGQIRGLPNEELKKINVDGVVVNTYHLLKEKTISKIKKAGGIHKFMGFDKPVISDSGGFQVMSLIHRNLKLGKIEDDKITFLLDNKKIELSPESCIKLQLDIRSDIVMCLDECADPTGSFEKQKQSVERTINWARRCKGEFERRMKSRAARSTPNGRTRGQKPLLFAIVQGGESKQLRKKCAQELIKIGFDGYAFGGWPVKNGILLDDILKYTASLLPEDKVRYCMGVGKPEDIIKCVKFGYDLFDCVIPTRNARHKNLFVFKSNWFLRHGRLHVKNKFARSKKPVSKKCDCELCKNYSLGELYWMFRRRELNSWRLATIHNLTFYRDLMRRISKTQNKEILMPYFLQVQKLIQKMMKRLRGKLRE